MIRFAEQTDMYDIVSLWELVFGDEKEDVTRFLKRFLNCVLVYEHDSNICSMLTLLPIKYKNLCGKYVYAVATHPDYRGRGMASELLNFADKEDFLLLVPSEPSLYEYYRRFGFCEIFCTSQKEIKPAGHCDEIPVRITAERLFKLRHQAFSDYDFFEWDLEVLEAIEDMYKGEIYEGKNFFAVCTEYQNTVYIKELHCTDVEYAVSSLHNIFEKQKYIVTLDKKGDKPSAMVKGIKTENPYFNLAMD